MRALAAIVLIAGLWLGGTESARASAEETQGIVDAAAETVTAIAGDPNLPAFKTYAADAKGMLIVPRMLKAGFIVGASGGSGALLARDADGENWSQPAFYTLGSVTLGLQIGGELSEIVLLVMSEKGMHSLLSSSVKLGGDLSIAAGPVGAGAKAQVADILAFSRTKGLYGGINLEGAILETRDDWNRDYYGADVRPTDILIKRSVANDGTAALRRAAAEAAADGK